MSVEINQDEVHMTTHDLIEGHGYVPETHDIWTEDGYCIETHRILCRANQAIKGSSESLLENPKESLDSSSKVPVIIHHGLLSSSGDWVLLGPEKALSYYLCDNGYDVWLPNARGNAYSKRHKCYSTKDKEYWDFSWHEIGYYDIPATIDYILEKTGHKKLYYIGYSQGTIAFYAMGSERPEYNEKIIGMVSLAPVAFLSNQRSPLIRCVAHFYNIMEWGSAYCNIHEWFPRNKLHAKALGTLLRNAPDALIKGFCSCWFYLIAGFGSDQLEKSMIPLILGHFPAGAGAKQIIHFGQSVLSGSFRKFDHGIKKNLKLYGSTQPPHYNLEKIKVPIVIFYSENDFLTHASDVQRLAEKLPNVLEVRKIGYNKFNHIDYLWGRDARKYLYTDVLSVLKRFKV